MPNLCFILETVFLPGNILSMKHCADLSKKRKICALTISFVQNIQIFFLQHLNAQCNYKYIYICLAFINVFLCVLKIRYNRVIIPVPFSKDPYTWIFCWIQQTDLLSASQRPHASKCWTTGYWLLFCSRQKKSLFSWTCFSFYEYMYFQFPWMF